MDVVLSPKILRWLITKGMKSKHRSLDTEQIRTKYSSRLRSFI